MSQQHLAKYDLRHLGQVAFNQFPHILKAAPALLPGFVGSDRLPAETRVAVQLRMAKLFGCPVCRSLFPSVARRVGLDDTAIQSALDGGPEGLPEQTVAALLWVDALVQAKGGEPELTEEELAGLSETQRDHLRFMIGLESVVHSLGLMFLPHSMIERAAG